MTPGYSPPEQYGSSRTDARSDIYALGATLFAALGNMAPEDSLSRLTDFTELSDLRSLNPKVTKKMVAVVEKALELRAEDRYQSADAMKLALLSVLGEKPVSRPITITPPPGAAEYKIRQNPQPIQPTSNSRRKKSSGRETRNLAFVAFIATLVILGVISATIFVLAQAGFLQKSTQTAIALYT